MTRPNQWTSATPRARMRLLQKQAAALMDAREKTENDILVAICEMKAEGLTDAAVAGMFVMAPSGVKGKAARGGEILAERQGRRAAG